MQPARAYAALPWSKALISELSNKEFRDAYLADQVRTYTAFQIRALREQSSRQWSQTDLAERAGTTQSVISRLENPDYGKLSLQTLLDLAAAFDLALLVQFVEWPDWLSRMGNVSPSALQKQSFNVSQFAEAESGAHVNMGLLQEAILKAFTGPRYGTPSEFNQPPKPHKTPEIPPFITAGLGYQAPKSFSAFEGVPR